MKNINTLISSAISSRTANTTLTSIFLLDYALQTNSSRTSTCTYSLFVSRLRSTLSRFSDDSMQFKPVLPLLTTKHGFLRAVMGRTTLTRYRQHTFQITFQPGRQDMGWLAMAYKQHLDSIGLHDREEGDLGPIHNFQWQHFGAQYVDAKTDHSGQGVDQLLDVINNFKSKPYDRRIILSAWNSADLTKIAMSPCPSIRPVLRLIPRIQPHKSGR